MIKKDGELGIVELVYQVISELYVYCHLKDHEDESPSEREEDRFFEKIIMTIIILIFSFTIFKMILIFCHFFVLSTLLNIYNFIYRLLKKQCCLNLRDECSFAYLFFVKNLKKFYTNNFYSYENKFFGLCFVSAYMLFVFFNMFFASENVNLDTNKPEILKIMHIIAFEYTIYIELICCTFFIMRCFKKQFMFVIASYLSLNIIVAGTIYYRISHKITEDFEKYENSIRVAHLIFVLYFSILSCVSLIKILKYDLNCKYTFYNK
jgi:hypothetical protein